MRRAKPEFTQNFSYVLKLLACVLNDTDAPKPSSDTDWASVFSIAKYHSVMGMLCYAVNKLPRELRPQGEIYEELLDAQRRQLVLEANVQFETERLLALMNDRKLYALPLKGYILKHDYPQPDMRTMTDVDILCKEADKEKVIELFTSEGYTLNRDSERDLDFTKGEMFHYEVHSKVLSETSPYYGYFSLMWQRAHVKEGEYIASLSNEDFYIYLLEHLAKHFEGSGAGVRLIMDVYVFLKAHSSDLDNSYINSELSKLNLLGFREVVEALSQNWFSSENPDTDSDLADFILCSCTFGTSENAVLQKTMNIDRQSKRHHSGFYYFLRNCFPGFSKLSSVFPSLQNKKALYPFYVLPYWCKRIFGDKNLNTSNFKYYLKGTDNSEAQRLKKVISDLKLSER
ncbi:MAG: nucleotidyltransferase family protein [Ruminococcus sp.]